MLRLVVLLLAFAISLTNAILGDGSMNFVAGKGATWNHASTCPGNNSLTFDGARGKSYAVFGSSSSYSDILIVFTANATSCSGKVANKPVRVFVGLDYGWKDLVVLNPSDLLQGKNLRYFRNANPNFTPRLKFVCKNAGCLGWSFSNIMVGPAV
eukprot:TRINITY_DN7009_c0_g3_i1.p1 TRINITY_DN7009_c0_g3~~TRINITY_DN7009_c0_g3_i1.p1  ORF type:complete len:154 (-),score=25.79 TRINITY_DN7009_c0_g3_i1:147-608(-)